MNGSSQRGFMKGKWCLPILIASYSEMTGLVGEERAVNDVYLDFNKIFATVSNRLSS